MLVNDDPTAPTCARCGGFNPATCDLCRQQADNEDSTTCPTLLRCIDRFLDADGSDRFIIAELVGELENAPNGHCVRRLQYFLDANNPPDPMQVVPDSLTTRLRDWAEIVKLRELQRRKSDTGPGRGMLAGETPVDRMKRRENEKLFEIHGRSLTKTRP